MAFLTKQVFDELCKNKAVLCDKCSTDLDGVSLICKKIRDADRFYFEFKRNETRTKAATPETNELQAKTKHQTNKTQKSVAEDVKRSFCKKILSKSDLKVDIARSKVTKFRCHLCSRGFFYKHRFNNHINNCIADLKYEDRPHKCNHKDCEKFFISSLHLKLHQLTHSGKYSCENVVWLSESSSLFNLKAHDRSTTKSRKSKPRLTVMAQAAFHFRQLWISFPAHHRKFWKVKKMLAAVMIQKQQKFLIENVQQDWENFWKLSCEHFWSPFESLEAFESIFNHLI